MSGVPMLVEANALRVLVVGGGPVATRRAKKLEQAGALVRIVSPELCAELEAWVLERDIAVERRAYGAGDIGDAHLVIVATNNDTVNATVARDADAAGRLANVASKGDDGRVSMMASHSRGSLDIGISAGVPAAAARIRDAIAERFDARYGDALEDLASLRRAMLAKHDVEGWRKASAELCGDTFCDDVEQGTLGERIAPWR